MNLHVPQSIVTEHELRAIAAVPYQIMSPKECKPLVAVVQDVALGIYRLTKKHVMLNEKQLFNLMSTNSRFIGELPTPVVNHDDIKKWSGQQALSTIIPANVNLRSANKSYDERIDDKDNFVIIENGVIKNGVIDKDIYQKRTKGLIHSIYNDAGEDETRHFFDNTQKLICNWLVYSGFSVGISDLIVDDSTQQNLKNTINEMKVQVYDIIRDIHLNKFENLSINDNNEYFETEINKILNKAREQTGKLGLSKINDVENRMINMIKSGAKGSSMNVAQMIACVGQQNVDGKRIAYGFEHRTLPHFVKYDDGPDSRGFVENSFISGLTPQEFFFHSMGGREGLIDTAVKSVTADTEIVIIEEGKSKCVQIGPWIDAHMEKCKDRVQYKEEKETELLELDVDVTIPNVDSHGNMLWSNMKYITRHNPDKALFQVETESGRKVTVTEYDSMLVWDQNADEFITKPTAEIQIGEFVPVTSKMPSPPITVDHVEVADYLSKTDVLYGTDFHTAVEMVEEAMDGRDKIPIGWWDDHNGKEFTLPYDKKSRLQRVLVRSDVDAIKPGCVHNYSAKRGECDIPERFTLDKDFGTFIGLFLAEGTTHVKSGKVSIANKDENVLEFVRSWFDKLNITHATYTRDIDIKNADGEVVSSGVTCSIQGSSTILAKFLDTFVGQGAANKFVPNEAYAAPIEFVIGLINGYFAGDGCVSKDDITVSSASRDLIEGMSHLCSRLGAFGKITCVQPKSNNLGTSNIMPSYRLTIRSCFAQRLAKYVDFILPYKNERLANLKCTDAHRNYTEQNDVVMDRIKSIKPVDTSLHPKLYDVTVPGTYNFTIKNGIGLHDTSETGYLQRKLVKAMEDCKISYDYTVRNASGSIIQFLYGEDGMNPIKIESQHIPYINHTLDQLYKDYMLTAVDIEDCLLLHPSVIQELRADKSWEQSMRKHFEQVLEDRRYMIVEVFKRKQESTFMYPVSFTRIINNAKAMLKKYGVVALSDLNPMYVLKSVDALCKELYVSANNPGNQFLHILIRCHLSPKQVMFNYRFTKDVFDHVLQEIKLRFHEAIASPSEMVGVVAAQSIGEPATQLSCLRTSKVLIMTQDKSKTFYGNMGDFIDKMLDSNKDRVVDLGHDSVVFDPSDDYYIVGVSEKEKTSWRRILQVSRHPANGGMVRVHTRSGKTTCATLSHSFLKRTVDSIEPVTGAELKVGDRIPVAKYIPQPEGALYQLDGFKLNKDLGWFIGMYLADGNVNYHEIAISKIIPEVIEKVTEFAKDMFDLDVRITKKEGNILDFEKTYTSVSTKFTHKEFAKFLLSHFDTGSYKKAIPGWVFNANIDFIKGIISGYFDGDGNVAYSPGKGMIRAHSVNEPLIDSMIMLLAYVGIFASKSKEMHDDGRDNPTLHSIQISRKYASLFHDEIGFIVKNKLASLEKVIEYVNREDAHSSGEYIDKIPELGDVIASVGKALDLPEQSRTYGRWTKKEAIGRSTLLKYIGVFEKANEEKKNEDVARSIDILKQAAHSDVVWDEITHLEYLDDPMEYVYDFTVPGNDSFMVDCGVLVHNTLNSVDWNTELLLKIGSDLKRVSIGDFIDTIVDHADPKNTEHHANDTTLVWIKEKDVQVLSCDEAGKIRWENVEAVTKHPPINKDGTNTLLKVTLRSGREVIATKAKSFLKRHNNRIVEINGDELREGDYLPVSSVLPVPDAITIETLDISQYLPDMCPIYLDNSFGFLIGTYAYAHSQVQSVDMMHLLDQLLGSERSNMRLPPWVFQTPRCFTDGIIQGYAHDARRHFHGKGLLEDLQQILARYGVISKIIPKDTAYILDIVGGDLECLSRDLDVHVYVHNEDKEQCNIVPNLITKTYGDMTVHRDKLPTLLIDRALCAEDVEIVRQAMDEDIMYDQVVSIKEYTSEYPYVYDLTVSNTKNFNIYNGLAMRDTFHHSGISSASKAVRGVPRIKELLSVTKNIKAPSMVITLQDDIKRDKMASNKVLKSIQTTLFRDIVTSSRIYFDPEDFDTGIEEDRPFIETYRELASHSLFEPPSVSPWLLRIEIDRQKLLDEGLTMLTLYSTLSEYYGDTIACMFSDDNSGNLVFRIKISDEGAQDDEKDYITELKALEKNIMDNTIIKGIKNIQKAIMTKQEASMYNEDTMEFEKESEWVISTSGTNMVDVMSHPGIDYTHTVSNDINEIYDLLGIEAARQALYNELFAVIDSAELYVNYRHLALLVDTMTNRGYMLSIDRHGINRVDFGPLAKCSFEETTDMLIKAGIFAEVDRINGVSANIMLGQIPPCGTGDCDVLIDEHKLLNILQEEVDNTITPETEEGDRGHCTLERLTFDFNIDSVPKTKTISFKDVDIKIV